MVPLEADGATLTDRPDEAVLTFDIDTGRSAQRAREPENRDSIARGDQSVSVEGRLLEAPCKFAQGKAKIVPSTPDAALERSLGIDELDLVVDVRQLGRWDSGRPCVDDRRDHVDG